MNKNLLNTSKTSKISKMIKRLILLLLVMVTPIVVFAEQNEQSEDAIDSGIYESIDSSLKMDESIIIEEELMPADLDVEEQPKMRTFSFMPANVTVEPKFGNFTGDGGMTLDIFTTETGTAATTYISNHGAYNGVVPILQEGKKRHKIAIAGAVGWVDNKYLELIPFSEAKSYNYYVAGNDNTLVHYISPNAKVDRVQSGLNQGGMAKNIVKGKKYLSFDGHYFYEATASGLTKLINDFNNGKPGENSINKGYPFYNYFQYLPVRTQTNLNKDNFRSFFPSSYRSPSSSRMWDMEQLFVDHSNDQGTNAALVFSTGVHESAFGGSTFALARNNFFGHAAYDSSPGSATAYASPGIGIALHSSRLIKWNYLDVKSSLYKGAVVGNKAIGMNVKYASDPYWGEKIANHYYNLDKESGFKDFNQYTVGLINATGVNIRKDATTKAGAVYKSTIIGAPIAIIDQKKDENGDTWYGFTSDSLLDKDKNLVAYDYNNVPALREMRFELKTSTVYIHSSYVDIISTGKNSKLKSQPTPKLKSLPNFVLKADVIYTLDTVNLRPDWSTDYPAITTIPKGTKLTNVEITEDGWVQVLYNNKYIGYISASHASYSLNGEPIDITINDKPKPPVTPEPEETKKIGDLNGDDKLTVADLRILHRHLTGAEKMKDKQISLADLNGDGKITVADLRIIHRHLTGAEKIKGW